MLISYLFTPNSWGQGMEPCEVCELLVCDIPPQGGQPTFISIARNKASLLALFKLNKAL